MLDKRIEKRYIYGRTRSTIPLGGEFASPSVWNDIPLYGIFEKTGGDMGEKSKNEEEKSP